MKRYVEFFILSFCLLSSALQARDVGPDIDVLNEKPSKPYKIISPLSADKDSIDGAYKRLKEKAVELDADAIIDLKCQAGAKIRTGFLQAFKTVGESSMCQGIAIKWK